MFRSIDISTSGLEAQRLRMDIIAGNIANANSTMNESGEIAPFQRRLVILTEHEKTGHQPTSGVGVDATVELDSSPPRLVQDPTHPHADANGMVHYPNVNVITEFVNAVEASRAYQANLTAIEVTKEMTQSTFQILS